MRRRQSWNMASCPSAESARLRTIRYGGYSPFQSVNHFSETIRALCASTVISLASWTRYDTVELSGDQTIRLHQSESGPSFCKRVAKLFTGPSQMLWEGGSIFA